MTAETLARLLHDIMTERTTAFNQTHPDRPPLKVYQWDALDPVSRQLYVERAEILIRRGTFSGITEEARQLIMLALSTLCEQRPDFEYACRSAAIQLASESLFQSFWDLTRREAAHA